MWPVHCVPFHGQHGKKIGPGELSALRTKIDRGACGAVFIVKIVVVSPCASVGPASIFSRFLQILFTDVSYGTMDNNR